MVLRRLAASLALAFLAAPLFAATQGGTPQIPLPAFPPNNWWNTDITNAPTVPDSTIYYSKMGGATRALHPDFGGDSIEPDKLPGDVYGFPFILVDGAQTKLTVTFTDAGDESDGVDHNNNDTPFPFYPVPSEAITMTGWIESGQPGNYDDRSRSDRHILMVDTTNNTLYELYSTFYDGSGWLAYSGAFFDMKTNNRRTEGWTSADAAGLAIFPGLLRYDEVYGPDEIRHAIRVTLSSSNGHVYPASHTAGASAGALPMGARLRLKAGTNISSYPAEMQKIFRAFKKYGLIMADNGSNMYISGTYDTRWDNGILNPAFGGLKVSDFEVIQLGWQPTYNYIVTLPSIMGANDPAGVTVTVYDSNYNLATNYTGTIHFTSTDGSSTLPSNYTFTLGDAGTHTFPNGVTLRTAGIQTVTANDVADVTINGTAKATVGPATPLNLVATATTTTNVNLTWSASTGATQYEIQRASATSAYATITMTPSANFADSTVTAGKTFVYRVRAIDSSSRVSPYSAVDAATTISFTDDPLVANTTKVKAIHLTELRTAINAMRATAGLSASTFTDSTLNNTVKIKAVHIQELRNALAPARAPLGLSTLVFTDSTLTTGVTKVKAVHVQELRNALK